MTTMGRDLLQDHAAPGYDDDALQILLKRNLLEHGYYLQFPPSVLDPLVAGGVGDG